MITAEVAGRRVYDLTMPLSPRTPRSSDHPEVRFDNIRWRSRHGLRTSTVTTSVHVGTHVDAPNLYLHDGLTIDKVPLERLCGTAVVVDVARDDWAEITPADLESSPVAIERDDIVILRTGWHRHYWDEERYILKPPGLNRDAVDWLCARGIKLIGSDSPSPEHVFFRARQWRDLRPDIFGDLNLDPLRWPRAYGHKTFFKHGICLLEWLGGEIDAVAGKRVDLIALPLIYEGAEAAQARVVALV